uniref:Uncharacterized protein n=1 Tax=Octopus bimaculoides TaxID=37653 RepID=A0A0L8FY44_OCTBM
MSPDSPLINLHKYLFGFFFTFFSHPFLSLLFHFIYYTFVAFFSVKISSIEKVLIVS